MAHPHPADNVGGISGQRRRRGAGGPGLSRPRPVPLQMDASLIRCRR
jgi:hypothetical protein